MIAWRSFRFEHMTREMTVFLVGFENQETLIFLGPSKPPSSIANHNRELASSSVSSFEAQVDLLSTTIQTRRVLPSSGRVRVHKANFQTFVLTVRVISMSCTCEDGRRAGFATVTGC